MTFTWKTDNVIYSYIGMLLSNRKNELLSHIKFLDEFQKHYVKTASHKEIEPVWFHLYQIHGQLKLIYDDINQNSGCLTCWGLTGSEDEGNFSNDENVRILIGILVTLVHVYTFAKTQQIVHLRCVCVSLYINLNFFSSRKKKSDWPSISQASYSLWRINFAYSNARLVLNSRGLGSQHWGEFWGQW